MIRDCMPEDIEQLKHIHESQGFDYQFPDLHDGLFIVSKVREEYGKVKGILALRITAEAFLMVDGSDFEKARSIEELQPAVDEEAYVKGLSDYICVVPPEIEEKFGPVMQRLGWSRDREWQMYSRSLP